MRHTNGTVPPNLIFTIPSRGAVSSAEISVTESTDRLIWTDLVSAQARIAEITSAVVNVSISPVSFRVANERSFNSGVFEPQASVTTIGM